MFEIILLIWLGLGFIGTILALMGMAILASKRRLHDNWKRRVLVVIAATIMGPLWLIAGATVIYDAIFNTNTYYPVYVSPEYYEGEDDENENSNSTLQPLSKDTSSTIDHNFLSKLKSWRNNG